MSTVRMLRVSLLCLLLVLVVFLVLGDESIGTLGVAVGFGASMAIAIGVIGAVANPMFTLALWFSRGITRAEATADWTGQFLGAIFGAILVSLLPVALTFLKDVLPPSIGQQAGLEPLLFGLIIVLFIVFEPDGIYGRWMKIRYFFETFPYYRKASFVRQKSYLKTERMR